jgi:hypothetical protein
VRLDVLAAGFPPGTPRADRRRAVAVAEIAGAGARAIASAAA